MGGQPRVLDNRHSGHQWRNDYDLIPMPSARFPAPAGHQLLYRYKSGTITLIVTSKRSADCVPNSAIFTNLSMLQVTLQYVIVLASSRLFKVATCREKNCMIYITSLGVRPIADRFVDYRRQTLFR
jgi:hypothetical protein